MGMLGKDHSLKVKIHVDGSDAIFVLLYTYRNQYTDLCWFHLLLKDISLMRKVAFSMVFTRRWPWKKVFFYYYNYYCYYYIITIVFWNVRLSGEYEKQDGRDFITCDGNEDARVELQMYLFLLKHACGLLKTSLVAGTWVDLVQRCFCIHEIAFGL